MGVKAWSEQLSRPGQPLSYRLERCQLVPRPRAEVFVYRLRLHGFPVPASGERTKRALALRASLR